MSAKLLGIGKALRKLRLSKGMTLKETASGILSVSFLGKVENGENSISIENLVHVLQKLGVSMNEFMFLANAVDNTDERFEEKLYFFVHEKDALGLEKFSQNPCNFNSQNKIIADNQRSLVQLYLDALQQKPFDPAACKHIIDYLLSSDYWGLYEVELLGQSIFAFSDDSIPTVVRNTIKKIYYFEDAPSLKREIQTVLLNINAKLIKSLNFSNANLLLSYIEKNLADTDWLLEKVIANYQMGILLLSSEDKKGQAKQLIAKSARALNDFGLSFIAEDLNALKELVTKKIS
ncbi:helix-turn-helix domain-containing protein [Oenococcus sp.]|uniref:helix-turn-helix domain-containing protein n=1 Tax=Oenococcus sp. TaxID=1979414 RepID=UPI0039EA5643